MKDQDFKVFPCKLVHSRLNNCKHRTSQHYFVSAFQDRRHNVSRLPGRGEGLVTEKGSLAIISGRKQIFARRKEWQLLRINRNVGQRNADVFQGSKKFLKSMLARSID